MSETGQRRRRRSGDEETGRRSTKALLIDSAERLFGRLGIDGVSLREIAAAAGQSNNNVVQYHFGDKAGLIGAILEDRVGRIEPQRQALLDQVLASGDASLRELLRVLWQPILSIADDEDLHAFARFLLQYMLQAQWAQHPIYRYFEAQTETGEPSAVSNPSFVRATRMLWAKADALPVAVMRRRLSTLSMMFLAAVVEFDNARLNQAGDTNTRFDIDAVLDMAEGALAAPCSP